MTDINGAEGNDSLTGTEFADFLAGMAGNDSLYGLGGDDYIIGGLGADLAYGGEGDDAYDDFHPAFPSQSGNRFDSISRTQCTEKAVTTQYMLDMAMTFATVVMTMISYTLTATLVVPAV